MLNLFNHIRKTGIFFLAFKTPKKQIEPLKDSIPKKINNISGSVRFNNNQHSEDFLGGKSLHGKD